MKEQCSVASAQYSIFKIQSPVHKYRLPFNRTPWLPLVTLHSPALQRRLFKLWWMTMTRASYIQVPGLTKGTLGLNVKEQHMAPVVRMSQLLWILMVRKAG
jgi:hypothetical protein